MDISVKTIEIARNGQDALITADNIRVDILVTFFVMVNRTVEDVKRVAASVGCKAASDPEVLEKLFAAKFSEALTTAARQRDFEDLFDDWFRFRDDVLAMIGKDLHGYSLPEAIIDHLEQTPANLPSP